MKGETVRILSSERCFRNICTQFEVGINLKMKDFSPYIYIHTP